MPIRLDTLLAAIEQDIAAIDRLIYQAADQDVDTSDQQSFTSRDLRLWDAQMYLTLAANQIRRQLLEES